MNRRPNHQPSTIVRMPQPKVVCQIPRNGLVTLTMSREDFAFVVDSLDLRISPQDLNAFDAFHILTVAADHAGVMGTPITELAKGLQDAIRAQGVEE